MLFEPQSDKKLKSDMMTQWIEAEWLPDHPDARIFWAPNECADQNAINRFEMDLPHDFKFDECRSIPCPIIPRLNKHDHQGTITQQTGAFVYRFVSDEKTVEVLLLCSHYNEEGYYFVALAAVPTDFLDVWAAFTTECDRLAYAMEPSSRVVVVGGRRNSFEPDTEWDDIVLPVELKNGIFEDVRSFFNKGVDVYHRLNLKPFRKMLLAGVPGTGKTMICSALAKWALEQQYLVIYVSSAQRHQGDAYGSTFDKIDYALSVAASSKLPTLIILEELDAYLHTEEKALILNVLDGSEGSINDQGTLLISTTNYPEAIDERVLKRPGRLDRIFIIPETRVEADAEQMLKQYLGGVWRDEHHTLVPDLVGYPGAFIREVAVYALTQMAYDDLSELPVDLLKRSFHSLKDQIEARDGFLKQRGRLWKAMANNNPPS